MKTSIISTMIAISLSSSALAATDSQPWKDKAHDAWLDGKAETTLLLNSNLNSFGINTDVKEGTVILTGRVESEVDKALAEELVLSLKGVNNVHNQLTIQGQDDEPGELVKSLTDAKVVSVVKTRLLFESEVSGSDINVDATDGTVTLSGTVTSDAEKDLAVAIAKNATDVTKVVDKLKIAEDS
jgi:hyperosmotically inducible periplasmic protein